jgi:hypothetical protein
MAPQVPVYLLYYYLTSAKVPNLASAEAVQDTAQQVPSASLLALLV